MGLGIVLQSSSLLVGKINGIHSVGKVHRIVIQIFEDVRATIVVLKVLYKFVHARYSRPCTHIAGT
jgi:hypothetical protein